jgi:predicted Zn-dependent protease
MNRFIVSSLLFLYFFILIGCVTIYNPATGQQESYFISETQEIAIGKNMARDIAATNKTLKDQKKLRYLRRIGEKIAILSDRPDLRYQFYILDEDEINAFALPGGYIFVNRGLIERTSEDELAFVLGHEIGHVCARHSLKRLQASLGMGLLLGIALRNPDYEYIRQGIEVVYNVVALGYSRKDELLADSLGITYSRRAGYDPEASVALLQKLQRESTGPRPLVFLSSHPEPATRIQNIQKTIQGLNSQ